MNAPSWEELTFEQKIKLTVGYFNFGEDTYETVQYMFACMWGSNGEFHWTMEDTKKYYEEMDEEEKKVYLDMKEDDDV